MEHLSYMWTLLDRVACLYNLQTSMTPLLLLVDKGVDENLFKSLRTSLITYFPFSSIFSAHLSLTQYADYAYETNRLQIRADNLLNAVDSRWRKSWQQSMEGFLKQFCEKQQSSTTNKDDSNYFVFNAITTTLSPSEITFSPSNVHQSISQPKHISELQMSKLRILLLTSYDCYVPGLTFVFGLARPPNSALVSTARLEGDAQFLLKECIHELGHLHGLQHCSLPCVMTYSNTVEQARQKGHSMCAKCWSNTWHQHTEVANNNTDQLEIPEPNGS